MAIMLVLMLLVFMSVSSDVNATNSLGEFANAAKALERKIDWCSKAFKLVHGDCAPCRSVHGIKEFCDCRSLEPKRDCLEFYQAGFKVNGLYKIPGPNFSPREVVCDQTTQGGGWTVIQRRKDGSVNFYRNWKEYKNGFGDLKGEFWFGNENINDLTDNLPKKSSLLINLKRRNQPKSMWAKYNSFSLGDESTKYTLHVSGFSGNATDQLIFHNNVKFSTYDQDNDPDHGNSAKDVCKGAWWYRIGRYRSNLNGIYGSGTDHMYNKWDPSKAPIAFSEMKIRRNI